MNDKKIKELAKSTITHPEVIEEIPNPDQIAQSGRKREYVLFEIKENDNYILVGKFKSNMKPSKLLKEFRLYIKRKHKEKQKKFFDKFGFGL